MAEEVFCCYVLAWIGRCGKTGVNSEGVCPDHASKKCWCGGQAVRECTVAVSFICGAPLCREHGCCQVAGGLTGSHGAKHDEKGWQQHERWKTERACS